MRVTVFFFYVLPQLLVRSRVRVRKNLRKKFSNVGGKKVGGRYTHKGISARLSPTAWPGAVRKLLGRMKMK